MTEVAAPDPAAENASALPDAEPTGPAPSLGTQLRQAREAQAHSIADVVQVIRFSAHQIEALERDDYSSLPGATSARGLVRNYAKFLKLDPMPLLALLDPAVPVPEADVRPPTNMGEAEQVVAGERTSSPTIVGAGALLVLALAGYWYLDDRAESVAVRQTVTSVEATKRGSPQAAAEALVSAPAATVINNAVPVGGDTQSPASLPGLRVEFDDRSWIEIRDAAQKIVLVGEFPAGTRQNVDGKPPFQIWIGKASGVRVFMGERSIDLKPHTREQVARFTLE